MNTTLVQCQNVLLGEMAPCRLAPAGRRRTQGGWERSDLGRPLSSAPAVLAQVHKAVVRAGRDPRTLQAPITCVGGQAVLVLTETRAHGALGLRDGAAVRVHLSRAIHCAGGS